MPFISDFQKLYWGTPQVQNWTRMSENCDYGDVIVVSKNCFLCFNSSNLENCHYCYSSNQNYDCNGLMFCSQCNLCYECIDSIRCYNSNFLEWCENLTDSSYCYNCKSLSNCTGCVNLFHKEYCLFNEQLTKNEYEKKLEEIKKWPTEKIEKEFEKLKLKYPRNYMHQTHTENCCGDYVVASKNCYWIFDSRDCEDSFYITEALLEHGCKDSYDCGPIANTFAECYDCCHSGFLHNCSHIFWSDRLADCHWGSNLWDCQYCFGCVYAKNKKYHILNKPYEKEEYFKLVEKHKKELKEANVQDLYEAILRPLPDFDGKANRLNQIR